MYPVYLSVPQCAPFQTAIWFSELSNDNLSLNIYHSPRGAMWAQPAVISGTVQLGPALGSSNWGIGRVTAVIFLSGFSDV